MSDERLAEIRERATVDVLICEREQEVCPRNSCYMPEVGQNARDLLLLLDELVSCRAVLTQHEYLLRDAEEFIDRQHTNLAADKDTPDCPACGLVYRLRAALEAPA